MGDRNNVSMVEEMGTTKGERSGKFQQF